MYWKKKSVELWSELLLDLVNKTRKNGRNIYEWIKSIKQYSRLISIEHTGMNEANWHFEDLEYLFFKVVNTELLSNVTEREL